MLLLFEYADVLFFYFFLLVGAVVAIAEGLFHGAGFILLAVDEVG